MSVITLTTDFGTGSPYVAAMKGVILSINPAATLVDLTHDVRPQDVRQGALVLDGTSGFFPEDTVHVAVVDPGVGTDRKIVYARIGRQQYVAPDNGLMTRLARRRKPEEIIALTEPGYWRSPTSATFHGRDIMAPVAARLSLGLAPEQLGPPQAGLVELDWPEPRVAPSRIDGEVLDVDSFGNVITNITANELAAVPSDVEMHVTCAGQSVEGIAATYGDHTAWQLIALIGSRGYLELAVVGGDAARLLDVAVGVPVTVTWE